MKTTRQLWRISVTTTVTAEDAVGEFLARRYQTATAAYFDVKKKNSQVSVFLDAPRGKAFPVAATRREVAAAVQHIADCGLDTGAGLVEVRRVKREDWAESWKRHFHPIRIGRQLLIKPSWSRLRPARGVAVITLDPGLSFGTGQHATTEFCLQEIVRRRQSGLRQSFLDIGTGSGILALSAARLGYAPVHGFDFDPQAVVVARENARLNGLADAVKLTRGDVLKLPARPARQYDLICANIISNVLLAARPQIIRRLKPGGTLVLAGILATEFSEIERAFVRSGLKLAASEAKKEWHSGSFCFA